MRPSILKLNSLWAVPLIFLLAFSTSFADTDRFQRWKILKNYFRYHERINRNYAESQRFKPVVAEVSSNNAELVGSYRPDSHEIFTDLYVSGNYVYLGNFFDGLRVIDVSDPANPEEVGTFPNYTVGVFTLDQTSGETVLRATGAPFIFPAGAALAAFDTLFVADFGTSSRGEEGAILRINMGTGEAKTVIKGDSLLLRPLSIAIDETGALIVTSSAGEKSGVFKVDPDTGTVIPLLRDPSITFPYGVAIDHLGDVFISNLAHFNPVTGEFEGGKLIRLDPATGEFITVVKAELDSLDSFISLGAIGLDSSGAVIAIDPGSLAFGLQPKILRIDPDTGEVRILASGPPFRTPVNLAVAEDGSILIADSNADPKGLGITTGAIFKLDPETGSLTTLATGGLVTGPFGLALGKAGEVMWTNISKRVRILDVKVSGNLAVVSNEVPPFPDFLDADLGGIQILDVSDPSNPVELVKYTSNLTFGVHNSFIDGSLVYLVSDFEGLRIVDISDPWQPFEIAHWELPISEYPERGFRFNHLHDVSVSGNRAYLAYMEAGLRILDVADPENPREISAYTYPDASTHSGEPSANGDFVYITDEQPGGFLRVIDIRDLSSPREVGSYKSSNRIVVGNQEVSIHNILVEGDLVYIGYYQDGFRVVDVSDPTDPVEVGFYIRSQSYSRGLLNGAFTSFPSKGLVFVSDTDHGLFILRFRRPSYLVRSRDVSVTPPKVHSGIETDMTITAKVSPSRDGGGPVKVTVDLSPIGSGAEIPMDDHGTGGDEFFGDGIFTASVSLVPSVLTRENTLKITVEDTASGRVFARSKVELIPSEDLWIYRDGIEPGWTIELVRAIRVDSDLTSSKFVHSGSASHAISLLGAIKYLLDDPGGIDPFFVYTHLEFYINGGDASGQNPIIAGKQLSGLGIVPQPDTWQLVSIPISEVPANREGRIVSIPIAGAVEETFYLDDMRLVTREIEEISTDVDESEEISIPSGYSLSQNYPNPFNPQTVIYYELPDGSHVDLSVYNIMGQKVATLVDREMDAGSHSAVWDGKDDNGESLASGVYLYRMVGDGFVKTRKLLLLR